VPLKKKSEYLDLEDDEFSSYVEFALENNWINKESGKYTITNYGKEFISELRSSG
jgi:predicted transcriptional regulator